MYILDIRENEEYARGHVTGAINLPASVISSDSDVLKQIPKDAEIILYCVSGSRSDVAISILRQFGYTNLKNGINKYHVEAILRKSSD